MDEPKRYDYYYDGSLERRDDSGDYCRYDDPAIVQALAIRQACADAGLLDAEGNLRKIIGTLPVTKDGCIFGDGTLWYATLDHEVTVEMFRSPVDREKGWQPFHYRHCYSTREAAERAAKGATDGQ